MKLADAAIAIAIIAVSGCSPRSDIADSTIGDINTTRAPVGIVMLAIAAAVALALGLVGIYGVISYVVSQRTREIGVRMAVGAHSRDVRRMVLRQGMILVGIGVTIGLVAAGGLTPLMSSLL